MNQLVWDLERPHQRHQNEKRGNKIESCCSAEVVTVPPKATVDRKFRLRQADTATSSKNTKSASRFCSKRSTGQLARGTIYRHKMPQCVQHSSVAHEQQENTCSTMSFHHQRLQLQKVESIQCIWVAYHAVLTVNTPYF